MTKLKKKDKKKEGLKINKKTDFCMEEVKKNEKGLKWCEQKKIGSKSWKMKKTFLEDPYYLLKFGV